MPRFHLIFISLLFALLPATLATAGEKDTQIEALNAEIKRLELEVQKLRAYAAHSKDALAACEAAKVKVQRHGKRSESALRTCEAKLSELKKVSADNDQPRDVPLAPRIAGKAITESKQQTRPRVAIATPAQNTRRSLRSLPPARPAYVTYQRFDASAGDEKAEQAPSPIAFPRVPGRTAWLEAHLNAQYAVLQRLYTEHALRELPNDERECNDPHTDLYCKIKNRLDWIESAL